MNFEWDDHKSDTCFVQRGFDFAYVLRAFFDPDRLVRNDTRWDYGEDRYHLLGAIDQRVFLWLIHYAVPLPGLFRHVKPISER
jgi:uncharacterized DUF497 family protein